MGTLRHDVHRQDTARNDGGPDTIFKHVKLLYISEARYDSEWHCQLHSHPCTEVFYCIKGSGEFHVGGAVYPIRENDLVIVNSNVEHKETSTQADPLHYFVLGIEGLDISDYQKDSRYLILNFMAEKWEIQHLLRSLSREVMGRRLGWAWIAQYDTEILLTYVVRHSKLNVQYDPAQNNSRECAVVRRYIDEHYSEPITLDTLADTAHVNKYYLIHSFHREFGISPIGYLTERRLRESRYLLENTNLSLSQISHMVGFSSPSYFSQRFRRHMGLSPKDYRKQHRAPKAASPA